jgi:lipoprotein-anchoring transpeptidase ErfK/SrfK
MAPLALAAILSGPSGPVDAVTFASEPKAVYLPVREVAKALGWSMALDPAVELVDLKGNTLDPFYPRLSDGTFLIPVSELRKMGAKSTADSVSDGGRTLKFKIGKKRISVDLKAQVLKAWQGERLIYRWDVSSGREGKETPNGSFKTLGKEEMHISSIYGSPMPYSVHINGNIYIHGSAGFTYSPGSHGCIRLPLLSTRNVAQEFYNWVDVGVPVTVRGSYKFQKRAQ